MSVSPMTACVWKFSAITLLMAGAALPAAAGSTREAAATVVLYNTSSPDARELAHYYAQARQIPTGQVVGLECPLTEEITREEYQSTIEAPLRYLFEQNAWWEIRTSFDERKEITRNRIRYVALIRGFPLKIRTTIQPPEPGKPQPSPNPRDANAVDSRDEASVDSELATLGAFRDSSFGVIPNPYFRRFTPILESETTPGLLLICRLDAPTPNDVKRMIDDSIYAEENGLYGWAYIDRRSIPESGYREGDDWLHNAAAECWKNGVPVILDNMPDILPAGFPVTDSALYYGWYAGSISGGMASADTSFRRGAVAVHIHSFSAASLRNPSAHWCAPLITRGAAATLGNVYEPYLTLTAHLDVFNERLLKGFTLAESAYMSTRALSWMNVVVGDPLYRPFAARQPGARREETGNGNEPWVALSGELTKTAAQGPIQILYLSKLARTSRSGLAYEALGMLQSFYQEPRDALFSLESAGSTYSTPADIFRTVIERIRILQSLGDKNSALKLIDRTIQRPQIPERAKLLTDLRNEISPPQPTQPSSPAKK
jgi:uncharacterized protein (TIGR03790 family)